MRAVNLIPPDARRGHRDLKSLQGPGTVVVGVLAVALLLMVLYVTASNSVSSRRSQLAGVQQQLSETQALSAKLNGYTQFAQLAKARVQTVQEIAGSRFDWQRTLSDLSRVVPANTSLGSVNASVAPGAGGAAGGASSGGLRGDISSPAFELQGCTATQDDVARLMSRLRLMRGVTRVTLSDAVKATSTAPGSTATSSGSASPASPGTCGPNSPSFDVVVFFEGPPAAGVSSTASAPGAAPAPATTTTAAPTTAPGTTTTPSTVTPPSGTGEPQ